jgi:hypothetical protein
MSELLLHTPWWLPAMIAGIGIIVFITGNRRTENRVRLAGVGIILLSILMAAVSYFVDTPVETAERRTRELVNAFERADWPAMTAILDKGATVSVTGMGNIYFNRDQILAAAQKAHQQHGFKTARILTSNAVQADTVITVSMTLLTEQATIGTLNSRWEFEWQNSADGWTLVTIRAIQIGQVTGDQLRGFFPR